MEILALILARGGSVRIPNKNIAKLNGKPLIAYTIEAAKKSKYINRIIVSTDDRDISLMSQKLGVEVIKRPEIISMSSSTEYEAISHAVNELNGQNYVPDIIVKLFPTSPFRTVESIDNAINILLQDNMLDSVRSVRLCKEHPYKMWMMKGQRLKTIIPQCRTRLVEAYTRSYQDLPRIYVNNASIDVIRIENITKKKSVLGKEIAPFVMSEEESFDINTPLDLELAEYLIKKVNK